jgi:hypothetical protein
MNFITSIQGIKVFRFIKVPKHCSAIFTARCTKRAIGGDCNGVDVASVANMVSLDAARCKFPDLPR